MPPSGPYAADVAQRWAHDMRFDRYDYGFQRLGDAHIIVVPTASATLNGSRVSAAYTAATALTPGGAALSASNMAWVLLPPGVYNLGVWAPTSAFVKVSESQPGTCAITKGNAIYEQNAPVPYNINTPPVPISSGRWPRRYYATNANNEYFDEAIGSTPWAATRCTLAKNTTEWIASNNATPGALKLTCAAGDAEYRHSMTQDFGAGNEIDISDCHIRLRFYVHEGAGASSYQTIDYNGQD